MAQEGIRGCGYRKVGGTYLVGEGYAVPCDMMPLQLEACPTCGFEIPFYRGFMWLSKQWIIHHSEKHHAIGPCEADSQCIHNKTGVGLNCPLCFPETNSQKKYGLMWVGSRHYTPESFTKESNTMGVCKRIAQIPVGLKLGETWILVAHRKVPFSGEFGKNGLRKNEPKYKAAIFHAFKPTRIEKLIWKSKATKRTLNKLKKQGITPVIINDGDKDHAPTPKKQKRKR